MSLPQVSGMEDKIFSRESDYRLSIVCSFICSYICLFVTMAQMAKYGTEGQAKNIIACTIFVCRPIKKLMVPMKRLSLKDLF